MKIWDICTLHALSVPGALFICLQTQTTYNNSCKFTSSTHLLVGRGRFSLGGRGRLSLGGRGGLSLGGRGRLSLVFLEGNERQISVNTNASANMLRHSYSTTIKWFNVLLWSKQKQREARLHGLHNSAIANDCIQERGRMDETNCAYSIISPPPPYL